MGNHLIFENLGQISVQHALAYQKEIHLRVVRKERKSTILFLEHPPVITLGNRTTDQTLLFSRAEIEQQGMAIVKLDRGGLATCHMPGQLVCYPIVDLKSFNMGVRKFVDFLEAVVSFILEENGIKSSTVKAMPGVFVEDRKIAAIGLRIEKHVSRHGLALNCYNALDAFKFIDPCGVKGQRLTTILQENPTCPRQLQPYIDLAVSFFDNHLNRHK